MASGVDARVKCNGCDGLGHISKLDIMKATTTRIKCSECNGTGIDSGKREGVAIGQLKCKVVLYQYFRAGSVVSTLETWEFDVLDDKKDVVTLKDGDEDVPLVWVAIRNMTTKRDFRRLGYMSKLISTLMGVPNIIMIKSSYTDSSPEGRQLLMNRFGFIRSEDDIILMRANGKKAPVYDERLGV